MPRSRRVTPDGVQPGYPGHGNPPYPPEEPTWASSALNLGERPSTVPGWGDGGEPTWAGAAPPQAAARTTYEAAPRRSGVYGAPAQPDGYQTGGYPAAAPTTYADPVSSEFPRAAGYDAGPGTGAHPKLGTGAHASVAPAEPAIYPDRASDSWRSRASNAATPFRRRKGGGAAGKLSLIVTVLLVLGLLGGGGYWLFSGPGTSQSGKPYFAALSVSGLIDQVTEDGFQCIPGRTIAQCEKQIPGADLSITVHFEDEAQVTVIEASGGTEAYADQAATPQTLAKFFEMAAALPLSEESEAVGSAKQWVRANIGKDGAQTFGDVRYESAGDQQLLTMRPAVGT